MTITQAFIDELRQDPAAIEQLRELLEDAKAERLLTPREAADLLGVNYRTLNAARAAGRVDGAVQIGIRTWRYRQSDLKLHPPSPRHIAPAGPGQGVRHVGESSAVAAIRGAKAAA